MKIVFFPKADVKVAVEGNGRDMWVVGHSADWRDHADITPEMASLALFMAKRSCKKLRREGWCEMGNQHSNLGHQWA